MPPPYARTDRQVEKISIFREISKFYFREVGQGTVTNFFPDGLWGPRIKKTKIGPDPREFGENGGANFLGVEPLGGLGAIL